MNIESLAARRKELIVQCAMQRIDAAREFDQLRAPIAPGGGLRQLLGGGSLRLPLTIAGVVLGMIATRPGRAMPMITAGLSLWKVAKTVLAMTRKPS